ncbi:MAG TPA: flagellar hook-basal body complex protein FliE [Pseudolabrys sp.]|jgi:flagellar hook-basal body complex protein FliE|nr:flagellar hook-basal body complex protein FliE [Pseudolabrys sp.]HEX2537923.1 flagellar hook-basal body complex protein FliE [Pseudolabrys sp.]
MATPISAASAYANVAKLASSSPLSGGEESGNSFTSMLKQAMGAVTEAGQKAEAQTRAVAAGKANMVDVVTAVSETEVAIDAVVAVRDKIIAAYQDIMKMPI